MVILNLFLQASLVKKQKLQLDESNKINISYHEEKQNYTKAKYVGTIKNFYHKCSNVTYKNYFEFFFSMGLNDEYKWKVILYPKAVSLDGSGKSFLSASIFLLHSPEDRTIGKLKFTILNCIKKVPTLDSEHVFIRDFNHDYNDIAKTDFLIKYLLNDELKFELKITLINDQSNSCKMTVLNSMKKLFDEGSNSDAILVCQDKEIKVHKVILAARCDEFAKIFDEKKDKSDENLKLKLSNVKDEKRDSVFEVKDVSYLTMKEMLRFIYTGEVKNLDLIAKNLLELANRFLIEDLKNLCEKELFKSLSIHNVQELFLFASDNKAFKLKEECLKFVKNNMDQIISLNETDNEETFFHLHVISHLKSKIVD